MDKNDSQKQPGDVKHIFSSDRPIETFSEDQLGRSKFCKELATNIANWTEKDSLILAVYGNWGDGKSSVKNLIKETFTTSNFKASSILMEFSPWQWSGDEQLTEAFFQELSTKLGNTNNKNQKLVAKKLKDYAEYLELSNELVGKFKTIAERILLLTTGGIGILSNFVNEKTQFWMIVTAFLLLYTSNVLDEIIWGLKWLSRWKKLGSKSKTLEERKKDLIDSLRKMESSLVVIIDDIDRLSKTEIKTLFRILKANADFPNIVYLTFFQRDIVENSLNEDQIYKGKDFLKKVVQVGFDLPRVPTLEVHKILFNKLDKLLIDTKLDKKFEQGRWNELFTDGLSEYFKNLRDVNRFISTLTFHCGILKNNDTYEINFIDLVGLEVIRQFEPKVYESIFFSKKLLTSSSPSSTNSSMEKSKKAEMEELLGNTSAESRERVKHIVKVLFPNSQWAWGSNYHYSVSDEDFVSLRINHEDRFDRYFSLFLPDEEIPQSDFEHILSITGDEAKLFQFFMKYYQQGRLPALIKNFEAYKQTVSKDDAKPFISVMLKLGDYLNDSHEGFFSISPLMNLKRIIHWYFKKQDFKDNKAELFWEILTNSDAIFLPISLLWEELNENSKDKYPDSYVLTKEKLEIKNLIIKRLNEQKNTEQFRKSIHLPNILFIWKQVDSENASTWLKEHMKIDNNLLTFLKLLESKSFSSSGYETKVTVRIPVKWLGEFFELEDLFKRLKAIRKSLATNSEFETLFGMLDRTEEEHRNPNKYKERF